MTPFTFDTKETAKKLQIYGIKGIYGTLDGAVNVYSTIKSYFDFSHCTESLTVSSDAMHEWVSTPTGFTITLVSSLGFMAFANRANVNEKDSVGRSWKYLREGLQASRNAFKGIRGTILTTALVTMCDLRYLILPTTLTAGGVYVLNRWLMLGVKATRSEKIEHNESLFKELLNFGTFIECTQTLTSAQLEEAQNKYTNTYIYLETKDKLKSFVYINKENERQPVKNRYIIYRASVLSNEQLYYVDREGNAALVENADIVNIRKELAKNPGNQHLSLLQLNELLLVPGTACKHFETLEKNPKSEPPDRSALYFLIRGFNGFIDGLYLYFGVLGLVSLPPPVLLAGLILSSFYGLLCIASRVYEEYQDQQKLRISQYKIHLAKNSRELELLLIQLNEISFKIALEKDEVELDALKAQQKIIDEDLEKQFKIFENTRIAVRKELRLSNLETFLLGVQHALPYYGAIISAIVFASVLTSCFFGGPLPVIFIKIGLGSGLVLLSGWITHAFANRQPSPHVEKEEEQHTAELSKKVADVKASFKATKAEAEATHVFIKRAHAKNAIVSMIEQCLQADPLAKTFYADGAEVIRSLWAGLLKGKKEIELLLNPLQQADEQGHYQDTLFMYWFIIPAAMIYSAVFAARAFVKGFNSKDEFQNFNQYKVDEAILAAKTPPESSEQNDSSQSQENTSANQIQTATKKTPSLLRLQSPLTLFGLFNPQKAPVTPASPHGNNSNANKAQDLNPYHYTF